LSSAILYLAIVAIWACVLIPRWLRRGSSSVAGYDRPVTREDPESDSRQSEEPVLPAEPAAPASRSAYGARYEPDAPDGQERLEAREQPSSDAWERADGRERAGAGRRTLEAASARIEPEPREFGHPSSRQPADDTRQRILAARRRLLGMLLTLFVAAGSLAWLRLAAWWVIVPPMIMLSGYLLLLREAAHADAAQDRRELAGARAASQARAQAQAPAATARRDAGRSQATARAPSPDSSVAPGAEIIDISGRTDEEFYDQYADAKLRAVGDLGRDILRGRQRSSARAACRVCYANSGSRGCSAVR
jgi:hypothetical protein